MKSSRPACSSECPLGGRTHCAPARRRRAFTLIELMVVVAIMGVVMTIAIPTVYRRLHPESMQKAVEDIMEACSTARANAIMNGQITELVIRPYDRQIDVVGGGRPTSYDANAPVPENLTSSARAVSGSSFAVKLSAHIAIEGIRLNFLDFTEDEVVRVRFFPNGICDEFSIFLVSDKGERRQIFLDVATGLADFEADPLKFK